MAARTQRRIIDSIIELKARCRFEERIGDGCGLACREVSCLGALGSAGQASAGALAARMGLSPSRASRLIGRLRERGFLAETLDPADRRAVSITLTAAGRKVVAAIEAQKDECERRLLASLDPGALRSVRRGLAALTLAL
jgi:DNA-binding MarR family transcriptional regulator